MISFSIVFFLPLTFLSLRSLPAVSSSCYLLPFSPLFSLFLGHYLLNCLGICALCQFLISHSFHMTNPCTADQFLLSTFFHSKLHSHFIPSSNISSLNSYDYSYQVVFRKPGPSPVVSLLVPSFQVHVYTS